MNWERLKKLHYFKEPVEHIHTTSVFDIKEYDKLYENQNNLDHPLWQEFDEKYRTGFEFKEDITKIDLDKPVIALWFFKERSDRQSQPMINIGGKLIAYYQNAFVLTKCKDIKIQEPKKKYIRRPMVQLDMTEKQFDKLVEKFK